MIYYEALLDSLLVVVGTTTFLSALDESSHQLLFGHVEFNHGCYLVATLIEHFLQCFSLWNGAGETVEDYSGVIFAK